MRAHVLLREKPWYRRDAFVAGLRAAGHEVLCRPPDRLDRETLLVIWNRYAGTHEVALRVEAAGGRVLVAENGYLNGDGGSPKFAVYKAGPKPHDYYCLGLGFHNDAARVKPGGPERWAAMGIELKPWRTDGSHVLICPNRSFGVAERVMHPDWAERCAARLRKQTRREVRVRLHPGNDPAKRPLAEDLKDCWAVFVWSSSVAVHSLVAGVPTFIEAPHQIVKGASASGSVDAPQAPDRQEHFERLAWAQWTCREIESGEPFRHLLAG